MRGIVKWYNATKGFGFITPESGGKDIFVHASALERSGVQTLNEGQSTNVKVVQGQKGPE
ncbi:cold-shock protein, partial [Acetobacter sp.]